MIHPTPKTPTTPTVTPQALRSALSAWWATRQLPPDLLDWLTPETADKSHTYRSIAALEYLHDTTWHNLTAQRIRVGLAAGDVPQTLATIQQAVRHDFSSHHIAPMNDLLLWSAVYHRYVAAVRVRSGILADWAGMSERNLRRHTLAGLRLLAAELTAGLPQPQTI